MNKSKKTIILLAAFSTLFVSGCSKQKDNGVSQNTTSTTSATTVTTSATEPVKVHDNFEFSKEVTSGTLKNGIDWKIDEYGLLLISGSGAIADFASASDVPWYEFSDSIFYVKIESGISSIGAATFCGCENIREIKIESEISCIGNYAFQNCFALKKLSAQGEIKNIGISAFENCYSLESLDASVNPESIGKCAFKKCILLDTNINLANLKIIEDYSFSGCEKMQFSDLPQNIEHIGRGAFEDCKALSAIAIPQSLTQIDESTFAGSGIKEIEIPGNIADIGISAFAGCENLQNSTLADGIINIEMAAFSGCISLESVTIPQSVEYIDSNVFAHCSSLKSIEVDENNGYYESLNGALYTESMRTLKQYPLGKGENQFILPASVTAIEPSALYGKSALESVSVESGNWSYTAENGVLYNGTFAEIVYYPYNKTDTSFIAPPNTTSVDIYAFYSNQYLEYVDFNSALIQIGGAAFENCTNLEKVNLPDTIKQIGKNAFSGTNLQNKFIFQEGIEYYDSSFPEGCIIEIIPNETE